MDNRLLKQKQEDISMRLIPAIVPAALLSVIGVVGNILTIAFYSRKSVQTVPVKLIKYLAVADLGVCIVSISVISEMILNVRYDPDALVLCKVSHFIGNWTIGSSWAFLTTINIDRYRKICYPLGRQIPISILKYLGICVVIFFMLSSARLLETFDILEVNVIVTNSININETVTGFHCVANCSGSYATLCLIFYFVDFTVITVGIVVAVFLYSRIIYTLLKRRREMSYRITTGKHNSKSGDILNNDPSFFSNGNDMRSTDNSVITKSDEKNENELNKPSVFKIQQHTGTKLTRDASVSFDFSSVKRRPVEWNITFMMFSTTVVFLLCFTPYFVIRILLRLVLKADEENNYNALIQFCLKLPYLNSAANPIIYSIFNIKFRRFIKTLVLNCCKCCRQ